MAGMIIGVTVLGSPTVPPHSSDSNYAAPRKLTLVMRRGASHGGHSPTAGFVLTEGDTPPATEAVSYQARRWCCDATSRSRSRS